MGGRLDHPAHDALTDLEAVSHLVVAVLRDAPEPVVVEHVDACQDAVTGCLAQPRQCAVDSMAGVETRDDLRQSGADSVVDRLRRDDAVCIGSQPLPWRGVVARRRQRLGEVVACCEEDIEHRGVELGAAPVAHDLERRLHGIGATVDPVAREGIEHIGDGGDAAFDRDRIAGEAVRVSAAVVALVMGEGDACSEVEQLRSRAGEDAMTDRGVLLHLGPLGVGERPGLEQHRVGDPDLADVMERARRPDPFAEGLLEPEPARDQLADLTHPLDMACAGGIARLGRRGKSAHRLLV